MIEELAEGLKKNVNGSMKVEEVPVLGATVDMLKDLCEAEYYARISKSMEEREKEEQEEIKEILRDMKKEYGDEEGEKRFYDDYRYADGRFALKGHGRRTRGRRSYTEPPYLMMYPGYDDDILREIDWDNKRMYSTGRSSGMTGNRGGNESTQGAQGTRSRYGYSHDKYIEEKRNNPGNDEISKQKRMERLNEHMNELTIMASETVAGMSPEEKQAWRVGLNKLINM